MKVGDLVRFKHFPKEGGIIISIYTCDEDRLSEVIDILHINGNLCLCRNPEAFEVVKVVTNESR